MNWNCCLFRVFFFNLVIWDWPIAMFISSCRASIILYSLKIHMCKLLLIIYKANLSYSWYRCVTSFDNTYRKLYSLNLWSIGTKILCENFWLNAGFESSAGFKFVLASCWFLADKLLWFINFCCIINFLDFVKKKKHSFKDT